MSDPAEELMDMALEELDAACSLLWPEIKQITPWGDSFEGFAPSGREVEIERRYLWAHEPAGGVLVEVEVRALPEREKQGAEVSRLLLPPVPSEDESE